MPLAGLALTLFGSTRKTPAWPLPAPKLAPLTTIRRLAALPVFGAFGRSTAKNFGSLAAGSQFGCTGVVPPGVSTTLATWVGAVSVTVNSPGQAWKLVPMVRNREL